MPSKKQNDQFVDAVQPALASLLSDLEKTTEILRRAGKKGTEWDTNTTSTQYSYRKSGDNSDPSYNNNLSSSYKSGGGGQQNYGSRAGSELRSAGGGGASTRNSQRIDSMLSSQSDTAEKTDYQTIPKGDCAVCEQPIVGEVIIALGEMFHPQHFTCCHCGDEIGHKNFFERSGKAYCENDYHDLFSPRCAYCNGPIKERCITAMGKQFHVEHFRCEECGRPLGGEEGFHEKDGRALCRDDYFQRYAPKCKGCQQAITSKFITALGTHWHPECFVCDECGKFVGGSFFENAGRPLCELHYHRLHGAICSICRDPISGRCVSVMGKKYHTECFTCVFCNKQLCGGTFKECRGRPYCFSCYERIR